jgi:hypothetical protein
MAGLSGVKRKLVSYLPLLLLVAGLLWLRLVNLGYSDYQGDEIKALFLPQEGQSLVDFLLGQRKGPVQFVITYLVGFLNPTYQNQFLTRLPFAAASVLAAIIFYFFVKMHFGKKVAVYATFFFAFNGILVALSRIVQYQSFVILFCVLALYLFSLAAKESGWRVAGLYLGMLFWALSILSHYDGIFIAPFVLYLLWKWYTADADQKKGTKWMHLFLAGSLVLLLLAAFYMPFLLNVSDETKAYWLKRISSGNDRIASSVVTFKLYNPKVVYELYVGLFILYLISMTAGIIAGLKDKSMRAGDSYQMWIKSIVVLLWFLFPWIYMESFVSLPGTHIYAYLMPLTLLIAIGLLSAENFIKKLAGVKYGMPAYVAALALAFLLLFYQSHKLFVDHTREYAWEQERFLFWTLARPDLAYELPIFGFPYHRHWEQIGDYVVMSDNTNHYYSNEKESISRFYIPFERDVDESGHYVRVRNVQYIYQEWLEPKAVWWQENHEPDKVFNSCDYGDFAWGKDFLYVFAPLEGRCENRRIMAEVFFMKPGNLEAIANGS